MDTQAAPVIIADSDAENRAMLRVSFEVDGYDVYEAATGREALTLAEKVSPQGLFIDTRLPDMEGEAICRRLRQIPGSCAAVIVFLSSSDAPDEVMRCFEAGSDDFVEKPCNSSGLKARLVAHLRRKRQQREKEKMLERLAEKLAIMNIRLKEEATTDVLTGLYNQRYFWKHFESEFARAVRMEKPLTLILMDLDKFKLINDQYGHFTGDTVLRELGKLMKAQLRGIDLVSRVGGEEFGIILPETHLQNAVFIAQRLRLKCSNANIPALLKERVTFSAGLAAFPLHAGSPKELYEKADEALYQAKSHGRDCIVAA